MDAPEFGYPTYSGAMFPLSFQSLCVHKIYFLSTFYQDSSVFEMTCKKHVQIHFWKEHLCALQFFLCALVSQLVCVRTRAQLTRNITLGIPSNETIPNIIITFAYLSTTHLLKSNV